MEVKTSVRDFSLLKDGKFRVNFDCYKARPHFIIALDDSPKTVYEDLSDDQKKKVINLALQMVTEHVLGESRAVLSQHCGYWYNWTYNYHAHLCVNDEKYLGILNGKKNKLKDWFHSDEAIKKYPISKMNDEVVEINKIIAYKVAKDVTEGGNDVLFHPSEPRVGFAVEESHKPTNLQAWFNIQKKMMLYATGKDLTKGKGNYYGCHVCLVLDDKTHGFDNIAVSKCLVGFIEVTGSKFYRDLCPNEKRKTWFDRFQESSRGYSPW